ncbi:phage tail spike protein [Streptococcus parasanguinis]|uniref:phage tail spike protein n=1 Tax=Streptococcus parasanguinis TaxID=1318 RepID=UPI0018978324|nr:phage tail spike protein [Streptococcus parasanguinis]MDB8624734.1 gp58-like family protein [Streptococcus parasanguinis]
MRPILFNKNEQSFDTYGLGELNVTKGTATRERNGNYTLYAEIPVNDPMVAILEKEMKLKADTGLRTKNQTFEISRIVKDSSNIVKIYGQHISHKLEYMGLVNGRPFSGSAFTALAIWHNATIGDLRFDVWSDIQTTGKGVFDISKMENARQALGGVEGSILDIYGGEYEFDNMTVRLHKQLGRTAPTVLEYGRNILSAELDETIESAYTSVLPFATYTPDKPEGDTSDSQPDPVTVTLPENYVDSKYKALYAHRRIKVVDFSSEFKSDSKSKDIPTPDKLRKIANDYMERNEIGKPKINIKIEYADLARTLDYADRGWIEEVELCDIVPVYYPQIGLTDETAKVTTITYDFINERNESVEFGDIGTNVRATMQSGLAGRVDDIAKAQQDFENSLPDYLLNAQGNKVWYNKPDDKEHKIGDIWFEKNGIYDRMYVWNGSQWEKRIDTEDVDKVKKEVDKQLEEAKKSTALEIEKANAKAQEALIKAGTIPDMPTLSEQIKAQVMNSEEFNHLSETSKLYERVIGQSETDMPDKLSRLVMGSQIFQTEVGQYVNTDGANLLNGSKGPFKPDKKPANFDNNILYKDSTSIYMEQGQEYIVSAKTDGNFTAIHNGSVESDNVVLWLMDDKYQNYQIVSDLKTGTTGTKFTWNKPTGTYRLRVNTYHKDPDKLKSVWDVKIEKGSIKSDYTLSLTDQLKADPLIEATRTQMTQLAGSWAVKNLNSNGDVLNSINVLADGTNRIDGRLTHITGQTVIDEAVIDGASIKSLSASKLSGGEADFAKMNVVNFDAKNVTSGTFQGLVFRGGRIEGLNGKMNIDLQNGQYNVLSDDATIRRIDETSSSQFLKMTRSGFIAEHFRDPNAAMIVLGTNHDKTENTNNGTFAGTRLWSGFGNGINESFYEIVTDRLAIYSNSKYRSPWLFHNNTNDGNSYLIPMNEKGVKHNLGRGDKHFARGYIDSLYIGTESRDVGIYLWDLLTCFGIMKRYNAIGGAAGSHVQSVLDKYGFR